MRREWIFASATGAGLLLLVLGQDAAGFIERLTPLGDLLDDSDYIVLTQTESVRAEKRLAHFRVREDLKGKSPFRSLEVHLTGDKENHVPHLLKRIGPGVPVVFFLTPVDKQWLGLGYTNGTWFQVLGRPASESVHWHFTHCEIYLRRTFKGSTEELVQIIRDVLAGKRKPPPPNPKEPPGFGPELPPRDKDVGLDGFGGRQLLAVILLPPLAGLLAPLLSLLFPGVLLAVWRQYRVLVYVLVIQSTILLVQAALRWWEPSAWWLAPRYWWWPTLLVYAGGLVAAGLIRENSSAATLSKPVALEWAALITVLLVGGLWAMVSSKWYGTAWDQMTPITLGSGLGVFHLAVRRWFQDRWLVARFRTGNVVLAGMVMVAAGLARYEWQADSAPLPQVQAAAPATEDWPMYRGNIYRTGCIDNSAVPKRPKVLWTCELQRGRGRTSVHSTPTLADGLAYVGVLHTIQGQTRGYLYCVAAQELQGDGNTLAPGTVVWRFDAEGTLKPVFCSPSVQNGRLYFGEGYHQDQHCRIFCLDARTGQMVWQHPTRSHVESTPTRAEGFVIAGAGDDGLIALQDATESDSVRIAWQVPHWHVDGSALVINEVVYAGSLIGDLPATREPFVTAFQLRDGRTLWRVEPSLPVAASLTWADNKVLVPLGNGKVNVDEAVPLGGVLCLDAGTGRRLWLFERCGPVFSTPVVSQGRVYFGSKDGQVRCLRVEDGELLWSQKLDGPIIASPALASSTVIAVSITGTLYALDAATGAVQWRLDDLDALTGGEPVYSSPVIYRGRIYLGAGSKLVCVGDE